MFDVRHDDWEEQSEFSGVDSALGRADSGPPVTGGDPSRARAAANVRSTGPRRTPRISLIVVLPDNHVLSPERLAQRLPVGGNHDVDIIVACAGQPADLVSLHRTARDAQFLLAPAGTSEEDLRELAMTQAPGDIVRLLSGSPLCAMPAAERELLQTS